MKTFNAVSSPRHSPMVIAIAAALALSSTGVAMAQQAPAGQTGQSGQTASDETTQDQTDDNVTELGTITVTADKRVQNINEVPSAISVIDGDRIEKLHATQLTDYANLVPGLHVSSGGTPGQTSVTMRGIAVLSSGATVGTYLDEIPVGSSGIYQSASTLTMDLLPYDIARIEVLRGPQGTLYGAGAMGGLLKYVLREPGLNWTEFRVGAGLSGVGAGDGYGNTVRFAANMPLAKDRLGLRVSYARKDSPGYIDNAITGEKDINDSLQTSARASLLWRGDEASLKLNVIRQTIDSENNGLVSLDPVAGVPVGTDLSRRLWVDEPFTKDIDFYSATLDWNLDWATFTSATGYTDTTTFQRTDSTIPFGSVANLLLGLPASGSSYFDIGLDLTKFTQEFRLTSHSGSSFEWILGAFYTREKGNQTQHVSLNQLDGDPLPAPYDAIAGTVVRLQLPSEYREKALFANASYRFSERFKLGAGIRYAQNDQEFSNNILAGILLPLGNAPNSSSEDVVTWSVSPQFQLTEQTMLYGKVATGYQPGGPNAVVLGLPPQVDSSMLTSYELGMKGLFADDRLKVDMAVYHIDWTDIQVPTVVNGIGGLVNGGEATSQGVELAAVYQPTVDLQLGFNASYTDATLSEDYPTIAIPAGAVIQELTQGLAGDSMPYIPKYSWSATADYFFDVSDDWEGNVGAALRVVGSRVNGTRNRTVIRTAGVPSVVLLDQTDLPRELGRYQSLDLYAGLSNGHWSIRAYLKNVTDERAYSQVNENVNQLTGVVEGLFASPIRPRTYGVQVDYRF